MLRSLASKNLTRNIAVTRFVPARCASTQSHAISNAAIVELSKRWEDMPAADQQDIVSQLAERQKLSWTQLTNEEKKAAWYISYGPWGPRRPIHAPGDAGKIATGVFIGLTISITLFFTLRTIGNGAVPKTMSREWQEQSDEYLKSKNANPWSTYSQVQSE